MSNIDTGTSTGIPTVDDIIVWVRDELGLTVVVNTSTVKPVLYSDGRVMIGEHVFVTVTVSIPVPTIYETSLIGLEARNDRVNFSYSRFMDKRGNGRYAGGTRSNLNGVKKIGSLSVLQRHLRSLAHELAMLNRRAAGEMTAANR